MLSSYSMADGMGADNYNVRSQLLRNGSQQYVDSFVIRNVQKGETATFFMSSTTLIVDFHWLIEILYQPMNDQMNIITRKETVQEEVDVLILVMFGVHLLADIVVHRLQVGGVRAHLEGLIDFQMESLVQNGNPNEVEDGQLMGGPVMKRMIEADVTLVEGEKALETIITIIVQGHILVIPHLLHIMMKNTN